MKNLKPLALVALMSFSFPAFAIDTTGDEASPEQLLLELQQVAPDNIDGLDLSNSDSIVRPLDGEGVSLEGLVDFSSIGFMGAAPVANPAQETDAQRLARIERDKNLAKVVVMVSKRSQTMRVYENGIPHLYPIATMGPQTGEEQSFDQDGKVGRASVKISTGASGHRTPEGYFRPVPGRLYREYYSRTYDNAPMPNSVFFNGGIALHATIRANYPLLGTGSGHSHGCVRQTLEDSDHTFELIRATRVREATLPQVVRLSGELNRTDLRQGYDTVVIIKDKFPGE